MMTFLGALLESQVIAETNNYRARQTENPFVFQNGRVGMCANT